MPSCPQGAAPGPGQHRSSIPSGGMRRSWQAGASARHSHVLQVTAPTPGLCCSAGRSDRDRSTDQVLAVGMSWAVKGGFLQYQNVLICLTDGDRRLNSHTYVQVLWSQRYSAVSPDMNILDWVYRRGLLLMRTLTDCTTQVQPAHPAHAEGKRLLWAMLPASISPSPLPWNFQRGRQEENVRSN